MNDAGYSNQRTALLPGLVLVGLLGIALPWILAPSGAMTLNAYDLAEWTSLHPAQQGTSPPLMTPLMLRLQPLILSVLLGAIAAAGRMKAAALLMILALAIAQLPPFEFLYDINNLNYRQQFFLAGASLLASSMLLAFKARPVSTLVCFALPPIGIATAIYGHSLASQLYHHFELDAAPGAGLWILSLSYAGMIAVEVAALQRKRRLRSSS